LQWMDAAMWLPELVLVLRVLSSISPTAHSAI
jgi:hypothetical protein